MGFRGHKSPLIWGFYAGNIGAEHEEVCEANAFTGGSGGHLPPPRAFPNYEDSTVSIIVY